MKTLTICLLLILTSVSMTACADKIVQHTDIAESLLDCPDAPPVPARPVTNRQDAAYKNDLKLAHADCHSKVHRIAEIQAQVKKKDQDRQSVFARWWRD